MLCYAMPCYEARAATAAALDDDVEPELDAAIEVRVRAAKLLYTAQRIPACVPRSNLAAAPSRVATLHVTLQCRVAYKVLRPRPVALVPAVRLRAHRVPQA